MKTLLILILSIAPIVFTTTAAEKERDLGKIVRSVQWKWGSPYVKGRFLKFNSDGTFKTNKWGGSWKVVGPFVIEMNMPVNKIFNLKFSEDYSTFEGPHPDGWVMKGERTGDIPAGIR